MYDIELLPLDFISKSLSKTRIVLQFEDTLKAIDFISASNYAVSGWQAWIHSDDGDIKSEDIKSTFRIYQSRGAEWDNYKKDSANSFRANIQEAQYKWDSQQISLNSTLYFCLDIEAPPDLDDDGEIIHYFCYHATLRIFGDSVNLEEISENLGLTPTHLHRKGELRNPKISNSAYDHDMWSYDSPVHEEESLELHIKTLWDKLKPHKQYLLTLKDQYTVDVFLGYLSSCDHAGFEVPAESLEMFTELNIPFSVSVIIA